MKKLLYLILLLPVLVFGQQQTINIGSSANDGTGDPLRTAFTKTNANFAELYVNVVGSGTATGTDTYLLSADPTAAAYYLGQKFSVIFTNENTGSATLNVNNLGAKTLKKDVTTNLSAGDIKAGSAHVVVYDGTNFQVLTLGSSGGGTWGSITGTLSSQTDLQAELDDKADKELTINTQTNDYTLALTDRGKLIDMNDASGNDVTVPLNSVIAFPVGTTITITQKNTEQVTVVATGGVTINTSAGTLDGPGQNSPMVLVKTATDTWYLFNGTPGADHWRGSWDPTSGLPDDADAIGSGTAGAIQAGDMVIFSTSGTIDSELWPSATIAIAKQDSPTLASHWRLY